MGNGSSSITERLGARTLGFLAFAGELSLFGLRALGQAFRPPLELREIVRQIGEIGYRSLPLIAAAGLAVGAVMSMHTRASLERFGAESMIPAGLAIALVRETGPLVCALLMAGRVGAAIGAELGAMRVSEQIDALETLAVDSFKFLAVTRIVACMIAMPLLTTAMNFTGIFGGFLAETVLTGMPLRLYLERSFSLIEFPDYLSATLKTVVFGFLIGTISSFLGYHTRGGSAGVGRASTRSVVLSSIVLILVNVILVRGIQFLFPGNR
jgi:phospholipid/cholesterol/gamma-HCH transport system permease protein